MGKKNSRYTKQDMLLDMYGLSTVENPSYAIASDREEDLKAFRERQLDLLEEMIDCERRGED